MASGHACSNARHPSGWRCGVSPLGFYVMWILGRTNMFFLGCFMVEILWWFYGGLMGFYGVLLGCTPVWKWIRWDRANKITFDRHLWVYRHLQDVAGMQHFHLVFTLYLCIFCGSDRSSVEKYIEKQWKTNVHCICIYLQYFIHMCVYVYAYIVILEYMENSKNPY
jgi:hypothetical protein